MIIFHRRFLASIAMGSFLGLFSPLPLFGAQPGNLDLQIRRIERLRLFVDEDRRGDGEEKNDCRGLEEDGGGVTPAPYQSDFRYSTRSAFSCKSFAAHVRERQIVGIGTDAQLALRAGYAVDNEQQQPEHERDKEDRPPLNGARRHKASRL
jgi:hypothetical protein